MQQTYQAGSSKVRHEIESDGDRNASEGLYSAARRTQVEATPGMIVVYGHSGAFARNFTLG